MPRFFDRTILAKEIAQYVWQGQDEEEDENND